MYAAIPVGLTMDSQSAAVVSKQQRLSSLNQCTEVLCEMLHSNANSIPTIPWFAGSYPNVQRWEAILAKVGEDSDCDHIWYQQRHVKFENYVNHEVRYRELEEDSEKSASARILQTRTRVHFPN